MRQIATLVILGFLFSCAGAVVAGEPAGKDYHDQDLQGKTFEKASLDGANFSDATLKGVNFNYASLKNATFKGANTNGASFSAADLTGADMRGTAGAGFYGTNLTGANFEGVTFSGWGCKCRGTNFKKSVVLSLIGDGDFSKANFCGASLRGTDLREAKDHLIFKGAIYDEDTSFPEGFDPKAAGMVMENAAAGAAVAGTPKDKDFHDQDLSGKDFSNATLNRADFSDATLKGTNFNTASLKNATFKGANIEGASFSAADLTGADMRGTAGSAGFTKANVTGANFEKATFSGGGCKCRGTNFKGCIIHSGIGPDDFGKANFCGANLRGADLSSKEFIFKGAIYDDDTAFPEGFDPKAAGMVLAKADDADKK